MLDQTDRAMFNILLKVQVLSLLLVLTTCSHSIRHSPALRVRNLPENTQRSPKLIQKRATPKPDEPPPTSPLPDPTKPGSGGGIKPSKKSSTKNPASTLGSSEIPPIEETDKTAGGKGKDKDKEKDNGGQIDPKTGKPKPKGEPKKGTDEQKHKEIQKLKHTIQHSKHKAKVAEKKLKELENDGGHPGKKGGENLGQNASKKKQPGVGSDAGLKAPPSSDTTTAGSPPTIPPVTKQGKPMR